MRDPAIRHVLRQVRTVVRASEESCYDPAALDLVVAICYATQLSSKAS